MIVLGTALLVLAVQSPSADSLRQLALRLPESALAAEARFRPLALRDALSEAVTQSVQAPDPSLRAEQLDAARRLAAAYAVAWQDSFLVEQVTRFAEWSPSRRAAKVRADSLRRAGIAVYSREGPRSAIPIWRRALAGAQAIGDTAGVAAVLGNIGAAFFADGQLDSAARYLERSRILATAVGDLRVQGNAIGTLAGVSEVRGDLPAARQRYAQSLALRERIGDSRGTAADQNNLGVLAQATGDLPEAQRRFEAALAINRRDGRDAEAATNMVNLAGLASLNGDFARARTLYRDALATWRSLGARADAAVAQHGLGQLELRRGDYGAAQAALREALAVYERTGPRANVLAVQQDLAYALAAAGDLQEAMSELRRAERSADSTRATPGELAGIVLARADLSAQMNALAEAEQSYVRAERLFTQSGDEAGAGEARQGRGTLLMQREDYVGAGELLRDALRTESAAGNQRGAALTRLSLGELARARGDTSGARRLIVRAVAELDRLGDRVAAASAVAELASLSAASRAPLVAESLYRAGLERLKDRTAPEIEWQLHTGLALALRNSGSLDEAAREFRQAIETFDRAGLTLTLPERRTAYLADKWVAYAELALTERARGRPGAAFEASERMRAREARELLARGRVDAPTDVGTELIAREQDLRRHIAELARLTRDGRPPRTSLRGPALPLAGTARDALALAQQSYAELLLEMREREPRYAALVSDGAPAWRDVARRLAPDQALIEYLVGDSTVLAFIVVSDSLAVIDLGVNRQTLARLVELARGTMDPAGPPRADSLWRSPLRRLHEDLIGPLEDSGLLRGITRLVLVPHAELHYLPFAALLGGEGAGRFLVQRYELLVTPSAAVWLALGNRPAVPSAGVLAYAPRPDVLRASRREVDAIARLVDPAALVAVGPAGSETAFRREAPGRRILHLATYGVLNKENPLFSYVELAPGDGHDGRLEVHEVFGLRIAAELVVLSACQTALGSGALADVPPGDDWVSVARAFLYAGAARVMGTLWAVEDWPTAALMERFYLEREAGATPERSLALAQRAMLTQPATAHPFQWAGFVVVGGDQAPAAR